LFQDIGNTLGQYYLVGDNLEDKMPWEVKDLMSQRYEFCHLAQEPLANISELCRIFGISRKTGYKWLDRYRESGCLSEYSRRPRSSPGRTDPVVEGRVIALRLEFPYWGPRKLHRRLRDSLPMDQMPALVTVARILKRKGLIAPPSLLPQKQLDWQRFAWPHPNDLWQMDLQAPLRLPLGNKIYPLGLLDDHSRYLLGLWMLPDSTDDRVLSCWVEAAHHYGLPKRTLTDHGPQFRMLDHETSVFRVYLWACGVDHIQGRVAHPQTQGKIERFFKTLNLEVFSRHSYRDLASWQNCLADWQYQYNHLRPHQELGDEVPASLYKPSPRQFIEPDRHQKPRTPGGFYRRVDERGRICLSGQLLMMGRGLSGWIVEARPLGNGCWHFYFKDHFIREYIVSQSEQKGCRPRTKRG
jgi:transposase InsO family protein